MIFFVYGTDTFRLQQKLAEIINKFKSQVDPEGESVTIVNGDKLTPEEFKRLVGTVSLFHRRRLIVIKDVFATKNNLLLEQISLYLEKHPHNDPQSNIIAFSATHPPKTTAKSAQKLWQTLKQQKYSWEFQPLKGQELLQWVQQTTQRQGGDISLANASLLVSLTDNDLWRLSQEITKLINYEQGKRGAEQVEISANSIKQLVTNQLEASIFALTEALASRNKKAAAKILSEQLQSGVSLDYILSMLLWQFRQLIKIRQALNNGWNTKEISAKLKIKYFVAQKGVVQVRHFNLIALRTIFQKLVAINRQTRANRQNSYVLLSLLIAKI
ncbi:DNA polymerase III subunit delta [Candidatus Parcubacteria bacterium]|nr:MAG: DNA polymerase III subunit delta [Candidatus Parcubacteria bacterium]